MNIFLPNEPKYNRKIFILLKGDYIMPNFNQMELNSIREVVGAHVTSAVKLKEYADKCQDPQIKQMFHKSSQEATQAAQNLINML